MEPYVIAVLITATVILALWLLARRIRKWKEQILHSVSIVESNNAVAHEATRGELSIAIDAAYNRLSETLAQCLGSFQSEIA
jgi:hypothetical protein